MPWKEDGIVGNLPEHIDKAVVELRRVATWQIGAPASVEEECVTRNESIVDQEAL